MCAPDPNAGIRMQAKIEHQKKAAQYHSEQLKYWNREVSHRKGKDRIGIGLSRAQSDVYGKAMASLGVARKYQEKFETAKAAVVRHQDESGIGRSNRRNLGKYQQILAKQAQVESSINNTFGRNYDTYHQMTVRNYQNRTAKNREALGVPPEYGAPVFMPPKDRAGQMWNSISMGMSLISTGATLFSSDIRLKDNIKEVGKSKDGYKIYEWNYKSAPTTRYRGVIAQDVMKTNPMAVGILDGYLGVDYDQVDVPLEILT